MEQIFEKNEKGFIIPLLRKDIYEKSFNNFFNLLKQIKIDECIKILINLKELILKCPEIGQILLDIKDIFNMQENGLIEVIMEKYIFEELSEKEETYFNEFFNFISNPFQIGKNIYDYIYRVIGLLFRNPSIIQIDYKKIFKKCIYLLNIFYQKEDISYDALKDNFFYLNNNEINTNISTDNIFKINNVIEISLFIYINENYKNMNVIIEKIILTRTDELIVKLSDNNNINLLYNYNNIHSNQLKNNAWNFLNLTLKPNNKKCEISITINDSKYKYTISKEINEIIGLSFFYLYSGIVSPILISDYEIEKTNYFSKEYLKQFFIVSNKVDNQLKIDENQIININENENYINKNNNEIPFIIFLKNKVSINKINENIIQLGNYKSKFPNYYSFNNFDLKNNIFLIGGVKNILPLFEILYKIYKNESNKNEDMNENFNKIIQMLNSILKNENNIDDAINSNFFQIFTLMIEKLNNYDMHLLPQIQIIFYTLFNFKNKSDSIFYGIKGLLLNNTVVKILSKKYNEFLEFLISLTKYRIDAYYFLINLILENHNKNNFTDDFFDKIFEFFYQFLDNEKPEKINDIFIFLEDKSMSLDIIIKTLKLIIKLISIDLPQNLITYRQNTQQNDILKSLYANKEKINQIALPKIYKDEKIIKLLIEKKGTMFKYIIKNHLFNFCEKLCKRKEPKIKFNILYIFQVIILYYISLFKDIDIEHLGEFTQNLEKYRGKTLIFEYGCDKAYEIYENLIELFPDDFVNKNYNKNNITYELYIDLNQLVQSTNKINFHKYENTKLDDYLDDILLYIYEFLTLARKNHFSEYFYKEINLNFYDLYHNYNFVVTLIPLFHHIYTLNQEISNTYSQEIEKIIQDIISDIYLDGIEKGLLYFLFLIDEFDTYIYKNINDKTIESFKSYFFVSLGDKISFIHSFFDDSDVVDGFGNIFYRDDEFNCKKIYNNFINSFKTINNCINFFSKFNFTTLDYIILKKYLMFFEIFTMNSSKFDTNLRDYIVLIIFCIILSEKNFQIYTKANKEFFFLRLVILSIKSILLKIELKYALNIWIKVLTLIISILFYCMKTFEIQYYDDKKLKDNLYDIYQIFTKSKNDDSFIEKVYNLIKTKKIIYFELFKNYKKNEQYFQVEAFPYILTEIFLEEYEHKFKVTQITEKNMLKNYQIIKNYSKMKKDLFSWNNSYSDLNLFYTEKGKKQLKYKVLNHYTEEMSLPFIVPIINTKYYIPNEFYKNFNEKYKGIDLIGKNFLELDFEDIQKETINDKKEINLNSNNINLITDDDILKYYFKITDTAYSCCLIKPGLHITGFIICKKEEFDFIGFPRQLNDPNIFFYDNEKKMCYGSYFKSNNVYYLNIKFENIVFVYKKKYIYKDNAIEIFTKQNKSYFFEFNDVKQSEEKKKKNFRNTFFNIITRTDKDTNDEKYYYTGKLKKLYNNVDSLLESAKKKNISKFEFLIRINLIANRSFKDIIQYPIFPWIISKNYIINKDKKEIKNINDFLKNENLRQLSKPIATLDEKRLEKTQRQYEISKNKFINQYGDSKPLDYSKIDELKSVSNYFSIPSYFTYHYLGVDKVNNYLNRIFPFSISFFFSQKSLSINNIFTNINDIYINSTEKGINDFSELIPEFYYNSEIFRNINNINYQNYLIEDNENSLYQIIKKKFNIKEKDIKINDVILPYWSNNNPEKFICIMREILERPEIKIFDWVDLTFGYAQKGPEALKKYNIYSHWCYDGFISLENINPDNRKVYIEFICFGINPSQILNKKIKIKYQENEDIKKIDDNINIFNKNKEINLLEKNINDNIKILEKDKENYIENREKEKKNRSYKKKSKVNKTNYDELINQIDIKLIKAKKILKKILNENFEIKVFKLLIILYNFYDGDILIYNSKLIGSEFKIPINIRANPLKNNVIPINLDNSKITAISLDKFFIFGTKLGSILVGKSGRDRIDKIINNNSKKINAIEQNNILNIFISSSEDGYINIYTLPNVNLINSIHIPYFPVNNILISHSPISAFLLYNKNKKAFKSFNINGRSLLSYDKYLSNVDEPILIKNEFGIEYLKINHKDKKKYKMPFLEDMDLENLKENENKNNSIKKERKGNFPLKTVEKSIIR